MVCWCDQIMIKVSQGNRNGMLVCSGNDDALSR